MGLAKTLTKTPSSVRTEMSFGNGQIISAATPRSAWTLGLDGKLHTLTDAEAAAARLVERAVDVVVGGIYSSTRQAIKGPVVDEAETLYIYPEQYEGEESDPLIFCTGPVPAQQIDLFIPWLMRETGARTFYFPSSDYIWPHVLNRRVREVVTANRGAIVGEEYFPLDHMEYAATVERINSSGADVVFNTIVPPGVSPFFEELYDSGFASRGGHLVCTYFDENFLNLVPAAHVEGLYSCLDYYQNVSDPFSKQLINQYDKLYPGNAKFTAGSACSGLYRGLRLWGFAHSWQCSQRWAARIALTRGDANRTVIEPAS